MEIEFRTSRLQKQCNIEKEGIKAFGTSRAKKLRQRLGELKAAMTLEDVRRLPAAACHPLKGERLGQWAVSLDQPWRLVFEPLDRVGGEGSGESDPGQIKHVRILSVEDYH